MSEELKKEILSIMQKCGFDYPLHDFKNRVDWDSLSMQIGLLSENFIEYFSNYVNWRYISMYQKLSEDFIRKHKNKVDWSYISFKVMSEPFIDEFESSIDWHSLSCNQPLTDHLLDKYADRLDWNSISKFNKLSRDFIFKNAGYIKASYLILNNKVDRSIKFEFLISRGEVVIDEIAAKLIRSH